MLNSLFSFFVCYILVVFVAVLGIFWQDSRFFWLAGLNALALVLFFLGSFLLKKQNKSGILDEAVDKKTDECKEDKLLYPQNFVKYPYANTKSQKSGKKLVGYMLFLSLFLFVFSVLDLLYFHFLDQLIWVFPFMYLFFLFITGKDLIDNKLRIFGNVFSFYFFLFISSFIVGILVFGTLYFNPISLLLFVSSLVAFLFFFVGYVFIKNQGLRYFFRLVYTKIYFFLLLLFLIWSFFNLFGKSILPTSLSSTSIKISSFFSDFFESDSLSIDPLLLTGQGQVITSGLSENNILDNGILEETGQVLEISGVNNVFTSHEELTGEALENAVSPEENDIVSFDSLKSDLGIGAKDSVSMIQALRFLMESNEITLSTKKDTKFTYVSKTNPSYAYWKTAYDKKIIGSSTNPTTKITCETYQVFKGMLLRRDVDYTSATVKKAFWSAAEDKDVLNGCVYGKLLKGENL